MLIWLASYPRSGNTYLRLLLSKTFGVTTWSVYDHDRNTDRVFERASGQAQPTFTSSHALCDAAANSPDPCFVKTHELPEPGDTHPAVYLLRDGRAAVVSYWHYRHDIAGESPSLADVIEGRVWGSDWSAHVQSWVLSQRPNTLVLRYESVVADPRGALEQIAAFAQLPPPTSARIRFDDLHEIEPRFFRAGSNDANFAELQGEDLACFSRRHGDTMRAVGYWHRSAE
ncbi:MAG: sulfotransferase domain-containing protein [Rhodanobacteraceae bacterium]|nr:sulfotransferase domain-containing protein [Rhodanobacteraceae bacterium]MBK7044449.1 sulfotransferase domain-containing protein [Rhodanobacteraceae bacterium]MBP9154484.1 sulfotransferase domain-containing protein [Xanthomonadales bacterium]HQW80606.1 sulfotransferase domain-containing protein [Pseudomonadota bacterium]